MNPFEAPGSGHSVDATGQEVFVCRWNGHEIVVSAEMIPRFFPLLGELRVSVDGGPVQTSPKIGMQEQVPFDIQHNGAVITGTAETHGLVVGKQPFRLHVDGECIADAVVSMKRGKLGFLLGVILGGLIGIGAVLAAALAAGALFG